MTNLINKSKAISALSELVSQFTVAQEKAFQAIFFNDDAKDVADYSSLPPSMSIDDYLPNTDQFLDDIAALYQDLITALQQTAEADASPRAYWDLAEKLLLRCVADCVSSAQDDMRNENNDSTFKSEPSQ